MRIISQDGMIDIPYENLCFSMDYRDSTRVIVWDIGSNNGDVVTIAKYSTQEKAMKVMEMLREKYLSRMELDGGYDAQSRQCIEEMGELTQAINKFWRKQLGCGNRELPNNPEEIPVFTKEYDNLIEEMADVQVTLLQMAYLLKTDIQYMVDIKLDRQLERIKREHK